METSGAHWTDRALPRAGARKRPAQLIRSSKRLVHTPAASRGTSSCCGFFSFPLHLSRVNSSTASAAAQFFFCFSLHYMVYGIICSDCDISYPFALGTVCAASLSFIISFFDTTTSPDYLARSVAVFHSIVGKCGCVNLVVSCFFHRRRRLLPCLIFQPYYSVCIEHRFTTYT